MSKLKPFAFLGYDSGDAVIVELPNSVKLGDTVKLDNKVSQSDPPGQNGAGAVAEMIGFAKNPTWVYINGKWYRIG